MGIEESVLRKLRGLHPDKQREALRFIESLEQNGQELGERLSLKGIWAGLGCDITAEDIDQARREMWSGFPREDVL